MKMTTPGFDLEFASDSGVTVEEQARQLAAVMVAAETAALQSQLDTVTAERDEKVTALEAATSELDSVKVELATTQTERDEAIAKRDAAEVEFATYKQSLEQAKVREERVAVLRTISPSLVEGEGADIEQRVEYAVSLSDEAWSAYVATLKMVSPGASDRLESASFQGREPNTTTGSPRATSQFMEKI